MYVMQYALSLRQDLIWNDFKDAGMLLESDRLSDLIHDLVQYNLYPQDWKQYHFRIIKREAKTVDYLEGSFVNKPCLYVLQVYSDGSQKWIDAKERYTAITHQNLDGLINRIINIPVRLTMTYQYRIVQRVTEIVETVLE